MQPATFKSPSAKGPLSGAVSAVLASLLLGCGGPPVPTPPPLFPVQGKVVQKNGQVYTGKATLQFRHLTKGEYSTYGTLEGDGNFILETMVGNAKLRGAQEGDYQVTILPISQDQNVQPITLTRNVTIKAGENNLTLPVP